MCSHIGSAISERHKNRIHLRLRPTSERVAWRSQALCASFDRHFASVRTVAFVDPEHMTERRIALAVGLWSSESVLYAWTYLRHCILRRVPTEDSNELRLDPRDKLFIVHVGDKAERRKSQSAGRSGVSWDSGGPLIPPLQASPFPPAPPPSLPAWGSP